MDSVEITCLKDDSAEINKSETSNSPAPIEVNDSPNIHFRNMANSVTSTPLFTVQDTENVEPIPMDLPQSKADNSESISSHVPNFQTFFQSAEIRPQDISSNLSNEASTEILLEGESKTLSRDNTRDMSTVKTPTYSDFESSAVTKPQDVHSREKSSQSVESGVSSEDFRNFENSVKNRPQDLSSLIDASSLLLKSERKSSELLMVTNTDLDSMSQSDSQVVNTQPESLIFSPNIRNLFESQTVFLTDLEREEETEQPHSIIITESPLIAAKVSPNRTFDSHTKANRADINNTYDSHASGYSKNVWQTDSTNFEKVNGHSKTDNLILDYLEKDDTESFTNSVVEEQEKKEHQDSLLPDNERVVQQTETPVSDQKFSETKCNGSNEMFATVNFLNETFEELMESNVDDNDIGLTDFKDEQSVNSEKTIETESETIKPSEESKTSEQYTDVALNSAQGEKQMASVTDDFLQNEKKYCQLDSYFPLLSDIRFTGKLK